MKKLAIFIGAVLYPACGYWVDLPTTSENLTAIIEQVQAENHCEEIIISDYSTEFEQLTIDEYDNIYQVNEMAEIMSELDDEQAEVLSIMVNYYGYEFNEALQKVNDYEYNTYYDCNSMADVAAQILEESGYFDKLPDIINYYFDFEAYGRDLDIEGHFYQLDNGTFIEIF